MKFQPLHKKFLLGFTLLITHFGLLAQNVPFSKGVNLTNWFQSGSPQEIQFTKFTKDDFIHIKSLGCDVIRLPINLHFMTNGAPDYTLDPLFLNFLDQAVDWAEELSMHLILDNHTFDPAANTDPNVGDILIPVWEQMANHYKDRSTYIYYEILNEPHGISDAAWNNIQQQVVTAIRAIDKKHTIIVGPAGWNSYHNLAAMPVYEDNNLIYTFHFYDPFLFTHQGASWVDPSMEAIRDVPFPYNAQTMPATPVQYNGTWVGNLHTNYPSEGTVNAVEALIDIAVAFKNARNVPVFCGEFGVYMPNSNETDRIFWYETVREYLEQVEIPWTSWDYQGGFGIFKEGTDNLFEHHLNIPLLKAMGLETPEQTPYVPEKRSKGLKIYSDFIEKGFVASNFNSGALNYYNSSSTAAGDYSIYWSNADQYNSLGFDMQPNQDLSTLVSEDYILSFFVKSNRSGISFDIRFLDAKTDVPGDHPWRMRYTIDENVVPLDDQWHQVNIPLSQFTEHGAWDENQWYNPVGAFDWTAIDRFEITAEHQALSGISLWFDEIEIKSRNTTSTFEEEPVIRDLKVFPNPVNEYLVVEHESKTAKRLQLWSADGRLLGRFKFKDQLKINFKDYPTGYYFLKVKDSHQRIVVIKN